MPAVTMTSHLFRFFPALKNRKITVPAGSVAEVLSAIDEIAPGFSDYIIDEQGALRRHIMLSVNKTVVVDKKTLSDQVGDDATVYIFQALTGG